MLLPTGDDDKDKQQRRCLRLIRTQDGNVCSTCVPENFLNLPSLDHIDSTVTKNCAILYPNNFYNITDSPTLTSISRCCLHLKLHKLQIYVPDIFGRLRGTVVERRSLAGKLSLSCAGPAADG